MKGRLHKLIDFLFSDVPDEKRSAKKRTPKVLWQKPIYENNPLEEPKVRDLYLVKELLQVG